jgi:hypothetical protein
VGGSVESKGDRWPGGLFIKARKFGQLDGSLFLLFENKANLLRIQKENSGT